MIALQQNFAFDFELPQFSFGVEGIKNNIKAFNNIRFIRKLVQRNSEQYEHFIEVNGLDNIKDIEIMSESLFAIEDGTEEVIESFTKSWGVFNYLILREIKETRYASMHLSTLLAGTVTELKHGKK